MPKISVVMTTYNDEKYINSSTQSILGQSFQDFEFIIVDDHSSDRTVDEIKKIAENEKRVVLIENKQNLGFSQCLNEGISRATGTYIARMDADDISSPKRLEIENDFLDSHPEFSVCGSAYACFDDDGIWAIYKKPGEVPLKRAINFTAIHHPTSMFRKADFTASGCYSTWEKKTRCAEDYDLWLKFYQHGFRIYNLPDILLNYRDDPSKKKDKFSDKLFFAKLMTSWRKKFHIWPSFGIFQFKILLSGLAPQWFYSFFHVKLVRKRSDEKEKQL